VEKLIIEGLLMKAIRKHINEDWILLYIERWLTAPFETAEGVSVPRERGHPSRRGRQSDPDESVHALCVRSLDEAHLPAMSIVRYADDAVVHCRGQEQAEGAMQSIASRLARNDNLPCTAGTWRLRQGGVTDGEE
jgi:RNA-directed DNA polymerase